MSRDVIVVRGAALCAHIQALDMGASVLGSARVFPPAIAIEPTPELVVGFSLVIPGQRTDEGRLIIAVTPAWERILDVLAVDGGTLSRLDWRELEELIAGAYRKPAWT
jgi:hypothetical protein